MPANTSALILSDVTGLDGKVYRLLILHQDYICFSSQNSATLTVLSLVHHSLVILC